MKHEPSGHADSGVCTKSFFTFFSGICFVFVFLVSFYLDIVCITDFVTSFFIVSECSAWLVGFGLRQLGVLVWRFAVCNLFPRCLNEFYVFMFYLHGVGNSKFQEFFFFLSKL